jgi:hypothetical protein
MFRRHEDSQVPQQPAQPQQPEYTLDTVRTALSAIGLSRLKVVNPRLKVMLLKIAWSGEEHLTITCGAQPAKVKIMDFLEQLNALQRVVDQYILIQDNPEGYTNAAENLENGFKAVAGLASVVTTKSASSERTSLTDFNVDTKILQSLTAQNT